mmetsp:Transcript_20804/g.23144  ORF Transcript_20804/g.23144 Transcript_20804/m.23144 type:complete len:107 (+) Transcript_20804:789-1109(+)
MTYTYLTSGTIFSGILFVNIYNHGIMEDVAILGIACGVLNGLASIFLFYATSVGIAGPAYALRNIEPIVQAIFGSIIFGLYLNYYQIIAIVVGILGSIVITVFGRK